jgi:DNA invertase Pin-like site-specific DNA recombinase
MRVVLEWVVWLLVGAIGGLLAFLAAVAIGNTYRRHRRRAGPSPRIETSETVQRSEPAAMAATPIAWSPLPPGSAVIGYFTIAPDLGDDEGDSAATIVAACEASGWSLVEIVRDVHEGPTLARPGLRSALEQISERQAQALVVSDLEPLGRSIVDLGVLMSWFRDADATLIVLDLELDTSTPEGQHVAATLIALSARDHERISRGTLRGLAKGRASGRPAVSHRPELVNRIAAMRAANMTLSAIAEQLNAEGVPTLRGGKKWRPSSIQAALGYRRPGRRDRLPSPQA